MFIQTEPTPNPMTLKFLPGQEVLPAGNTKFYTSEKAAEESPLATRLFGIKGVNAIFLGADFITVTKGDTLEWSAIKADLLGAIMDHFVAGEPVLKTAPNAPEKEASSAVEESGENADIIKQIKELLETRVRPAVAQDGGDIIFHSFDNGIVRLEMRGACSGCPSSTMTLKGGIENMLRHYVPEVEGVEAV